jgi:hypothetical protein
MTECNQSSFGFQACGSREIVARFDGGTISSDGGALLLRESDRRLNWLPRLAECFLDGREQERVTHSVQEMLSQRVYGLALGYEDVNDHEQLRNDPLFGVLAGRKEVDKPLAGKSTLNRLELGDGREDRYKKIIFWKQALNELLVSVFLESQEKPPEELILDVDTTDLPLHGKQEGGFFHAPPSTSSGSKNTSATSTTLGPRLTAWSRRRTRRVSASSWISRERQQSGQGRREWGAL